MDDGFCYQQEDIRDNLWHNPGESGLDANGLPKQTNGVDDDGNGYVDDVIGWDFAFSEPDPDCYVFDGMNRDRVQPYTHSMPALGIIGAKGNNGIGVAGINWDVSMMLLKIRHSGDPPRQHQSRAQTAGGPGDPVHGRQRCACHRVEWLGRRQGHPGRGRLAGGRQSQPEGRVDRRGCGQRRARSRRAGEFDLSAGLQDRERARCGRGDAGRKAGSVVGSDRISSSDYGRTTVHIGAVGRNYSTGFRNGQGVYSLGGGTSHAAPVVAGVAALVFTIRPNLSVRR